MNDSFILGISGSLRPQSVCVAALNIAARSIRSAGLGMQMLTGTDIIFPPFDPAAAYASPAAGVREFVDLCRQASGFVWASPAYHGSVPGSFKNALDYLDLLRGSDPPFLNDKPVGIISIGSGTMAVVNTANTLVYVAQALRAQPLSLMVAIGRAHEAFSPDGECTDSDVRQRLLTLGGEVVRSAHAAERLKDETANVRLRIPS